MDSDQHSSSPVSQAGNGTTALAGFLNKLNPVTLVAVLAMGGGNWFATEKTSSTQREETQKAISQLHDLHDAFGPFESRQKEILEDLNQVQRNQTLLLANQMELLKKLNQSLHQP